jgi:hypothetical protein
LDALPAAHTVGPPLGTEFDAPATVVPDRAVGAGAGIGMERVFHKPRYCSVMVPSSTTVTSASLRSQKPVSRVAAAAPSRATTDTGAPDEPAPRAASTSSSPGMIVSSVHALGIG